MAHLIDLTPKNALMVVRTAVEEVLGARNAAEDVRLRDLGATSLDAIELIMAMEELTGMSLPEDFQVEIDDRLDAIVARLVQQERDLAEEAANVPPSTALKP